jgi:hypothetical protein
MWQPLTSWLEVYATQLRITPLHGLRKMAVFSLQRELTDKLAVIARAEMDAARLNLVILYRQIGLVECKDQLEQQLRQVYLDVLKACAVRGVLADCEAQLAWKLESFGKVVEC